MSKPTVVSDMKALLAALAVATTAAALIINRAPAAPAGAKSPPAVAASRPTNRLDAQRSYGYLKETCAFRPRPSGSAAMLKQQAYLKEYFEKLGATVTFQRFLANNP